MKESSNTPETTTIDFYGEELVTILIDGKLFIAMRPIVEAIGLNWASQSVKLNQNKKKFNCCDIATVGKDGKEREMLCIPITKLNGYLFSISPERIPNESTRKKVELYQDECFVVLHDYWHNGIATNHRMAEIYPDIEMVDFNGTQIMTMLFSDVEYVGIKSVIDGMGLNWEKQINKLQNDEEKEFYYKEVPIIGTDGSESVLPCVPVSKLRHWMYDLDYDALSVAQQKKYDLYVKGCFETLRDYWRSKRVELAGSPTVSNNLLQEELKNAEAVRKALEMRLRDASRISPQDLTLLFKAVTEGYWIVNKAAHTYRELLGNMTKAQRNLNEVTRLLRQVFPDAFQELDVMLLTTASTY